VTGANASGAPSATIQDGGSLVNFYGTATIGVGSGQAGTVTVTGTNSKWTDYGNLYVGSTPGASGGTGTLVIANGGVVNVNPYTSTSAGVTTTSGGLITAGANGGAGTITFANGTLNTKSIYISGSQLTGTGTINTKGIVADTTGGLTFDTAHGGSLQTIYFNDGNGGTVTANVDMTNSSNVGDLGAGNFGNSTIQINGIAANSDYGRLGVSTGAVGSGTVTAASGTGSWHMAPPSASTAPET
jgi:T5SS/PEP-CTERM-associated repeat protein